MVIHFPKLRSLTIPKAVTETKVKMGYPHLIECHSHCMCRCVCIISCFPCKIFYWSLLTNRMKNRFLFGNFLCYSIRVLFLLTLAFRFPAKKYLYDKNETNDDWMDFAWVCACIRACVRTCSFVWVIQIHATKRLFYFYWNLVVLSNKNATLLDTFYSEYFTFFKSLAFNS